jgi:dephospho-CoA kinase
VEVIEKLGFKKVYFGGLTLEVVKERGLAVNEENERKVRESLRQEHGMAAYAKLNLPKIKALLDSGEQVEVDGLYSWEEYLVLKDALPQMKLIGIYAPPELRYQRLSQRKIRPLTKDVAISRDYAQIEKLHQAGPIAMADFTITNTGSLNELEKMVEGIINGKS